jgi:phage gp36-like protein
VSSYVTIERFKLLTVLTAQTVDEWVRKHTIESFDATVESESAYVDSRLAKRYAIPFKFPYSDVVVRWTCDLVSERMLDRRGANPQDNDLRERITARAEKVREELKEAADSKDGLFDLPVRDDTSTSGIVTSDTLAVSEASPYSWVDTQREALNG